MCRLLGVLADEAREFGRCLKHAPRSLAALSMEHPDGWGVAVWHPTVGWVLRKRPVRAQEDVSFSELAEQTRGFVLVAHVRQRTVGPAIVENTHPFWCGRWIFAHNGTIDDVAYLRSRISETRRVGIRGSTDSEVLFAFLLTRLDFAGRSESSSDGATDRVIAEAVDELSRRACFGSYNFLLSDGATIYAQRRGRSLYVLERPELSRRTTALVASEAITDESWRVLPEGSLVRCRRDASMQWYQLR